MTYQLESSAFSHGDPIPKVYSCDGENVSPPLTWGEPPAGAEALVLIMDDPDAPSGDFVHWVLYGLPAQAGSLPQGVAAEENRSDGSRHGTNGRGQLGYTGPCPPGGTHRYFFRLHAVDGQVDLPAGQSKQAILRYIEGHILATAELMGTYSR
jgi:Raf kinase inhibitor-like YbhB/YbcL family protein